MARIDSHGCQVDGCLRPRAEGAGRISSTSLLQLTGVERLPRAKNEIWHPVRSQSCGRLGEEYRPAPSTRGRRHPSTWQPWLSSRAVRASPDDQLDGHGANSVPRIVFRTVGPHRVWYHTRTADCTSKPAVSFEECKARIPKNWSLKLVTMPAIFPCMLHHDHCHVAVPKLFPPSLITLPNTTE